MTTESELLHWVVFFAIVAAALADRPLLRRPQGRRGQDPHRLRLERRLDLARARLLRPRVPVVRRRGGAAVPRRLPHRRVAQHRQPLRLPARVRLARHRPALPAQGALLGHPRGDDHARRLHRRRRQPHLPLRVDRLHLRGAARVHRLPARALARRAGRAGEEPAGAVRAAPLPRRRRLRGASASSSAAAARRFITSAGHRPRRHRVGRPRVRHRLRAGRARRLRHHLRRLHQQHRRHPRPALALLRARRQPAALRVPELRARLRPRVRGREDAHQPLGGDPDPRLAGRDRGGRRRVGGRLAGADAGREARRGGARGGRPDRPRRGPRRASRRSGERESDDAPPARTTTDRRTDAPDEARATRSPNGALLSRSPRRGNI